MPWFQKACRNLGLTIHNVVQPVKDHNKTVVNKTVEEEQLNPTTTLRRTTIEEIEVKPTPPPPEAESKPN